MAFRWMGLIASGVGILLLAGSAHGQAVVQGPGTTQPKSLAVPRVLPLPESEWTDVERQFVAKYAPQGRPDNGLRTMLRVPALVEGVMPYTLYLSEESTLTPRHRAVLILRAAWLFGSQPLWAAYAPRGRAAGLGAAELRRIAEGPGARGWDPFEATLLRLADELYRTQAVADATWLAASASYDPFHVMDAVETVNHFVVLSMFYHALGVQPDAGLSDRLPTDVRYRVDVPRREPPLTTARYTPLEGRGIAVTRTFQRHPVLNERWSPRQTFILRTSKLTPHDGELLILRSGWNCRSEYEWAKHVGSVGRAREHGLEPLHIAEGAASPAWSPREKTLLAVADELYSDRGVSDATWRALTAEYDTGLVMSAVFSTADYQAISMSLNAYGVQLEDGDERFPNLGAR